MPSLARVRTHAFFLPGSTGALYTAYIAREAAAEPRRALLWCPPFGEEMNRSRRASVVFARRSAAAGVPVLMPDLYGTGDSEGEFDDARWAIWRDDLQRAAAWLAERGVEEIGVWGVRLGAIFALEQARTLAARCPWMLLWQPLTLGRTFVRQQLRLRLAGELLSEGKGGDTAALRARAQREGGLEIGGYFFSSALLDDLEGAAFQVGSPGPTPKTHWIEVLRDASRPAPPASRSTVERLCAAGVEAHLHTVEGAAFWDTPEIVVPGSLIELSGKLVAAWADG